MTDLKRRIGELTPELRIRLEQRLQARANKNALPAIPRRPERDSYPLSFSQQRLWFLQQWDPQSCSYNDTFALRLQGPLDAAALRQALDAVVLRHEALRTRFVAHDGQPVQVIAPAVPVPLPFEVLPADSALEMARWARRESRCPFDLSKGLLLRARLLQVAPDDHTLLLSLHHIASDGWSLRLMFQELSALYGAYAAGQPSPLPPLPVQYADFALWQHGWLEGEVLARQLAYWKEQLGGELPALALPSDKPRPAVRTQAGRRHGLALPAELTDALKRLAQREGVTLYMVLLAAFQTLLHRYSGQDDILVGSPVANRTRVETEGMLGVFINTLVLRTNLAGNPEFGELLGRVRAMAQGAYAHQQVPFEKLVEELRADRDPSRTPLFQALFTLLDPRPRLAWPGLEVTLTEVDAGTAKFDLTLALEEIDGELRGFLEYSTDLFEADTIARWAVHWRTLLEGIVEDPGRPIGELPLLGPAERRQVLGEWNGTDAPIPELCLPDLLTAQAARRPDAIAVVCGGRTLTYEELDKQSNRLAHYLRDRGVGPDVLVGTCLERTPALVVSLLAILKAGGAYVPFDPAYPQERLAFMLGDSKVSVIVTEQDLAGSLPGSFGLRVLIDAERSAIGQQPDTPVENAGITPSHLAYVIYTSGSTGTPKGVQIEHRAVINFLESMRHQPGLTQDDAVLAITTLNFDIAGLELYLPLAVGARIILASREEALDAGLLAERIRASRCSVVQATPSTWRLLLQSGWPGDPSIQALCGGEPLCPDMADELLDRVGSLWNMYGPTETTIWSTLCPIDRERPILIGRPIANTQIYILDRNLEPVPIGVPGELYIGGAGLARGYLNRPELTAERFIVHPELGARIYKTGDMARLHRDGRIECLGRMDHQVKIRGFRIELGEIEAVLCKHPAVINAAVVAQPDPSGEPSLIAYVCMGEEGLPALRNYLGRKLPYYMIPAAFVSVPAIPLTPGGKVDRKALPKPEAPALDARARGKRPPRNLMEDLIAEIWKRVLALETVDPDDNFFELGGHSLSAMKVISRIRESCRAELPLRKFFECPTVAGMASALLPPETAASRPIVPRQAEDSPIPLSFSQLRLWFLQQWDTQSWSYNDTFGLRFQGPLNVSALQSALDALVARHEALRTRFVAEDGRPVQVIEPPLPVHLPVQPVSGTSEIENAARRESQKLFDLAAGTLFRARLLAISPQDHVLLLTLHHIAFDGWSIRVLLDELSRLYKAFAGGEPCPLMPQPVQYADYAIWQNRWLTSEVLEPHLAYWKRQLGGELPLLSLPTDRPRPAARTHGGRRYKFNLPAALTGKLKSLARQEGVTLYMLLVAAFQTLLHRYTGQDDILIGSPAANRGRVETEGMIGVFINTLVLRSNLSGDPTFHELLLRVREVALAAYAHQEFPFEKLVAEMRADRDPSRTPIFQALFTLQDHRPNLDWLGLQATLSEVDTETAKFDLTLALEDVDGRLCGFFEYSTDLFDEETIVRWSAHWKTLLEGIVDNPSQSIGKLPLLPDDERRRVLLEWNHTAAAIPDASLPDLFSSQAAKTPGRVAVVCGERALTYRQLDLESNRLAHYLRQRGVGPDVLVGVCLERTPAMAVALLGILKAGGAYVPLDPTYPPERLALMLEDIQAPVVVAEQALADSLPPGPGVRVLIDSERTDIARQPSDRPAGVGVAAHNLAYVMYTSGSTGIPKGVQVEHRAIVRLVFGQDYVPFDDPGVYLHHSPISFDASTFELWAPLLHGGLCVMLPGRVPTPKILQDAIRENGVDALWLTAALFNTIVDEAPETLAGVARVLTGGEALSVSHVRRALQLFPGTAIINGYGPTESTTFAATYRVPGDIAPSARSIPIGRPIGNTRIYLLDRFHYPVPIGIPGELWIGGPGLSRGYLNRQDLTSEKFILVQLPEGIKERLYRTGDHARFLPDGRIEFLGRIDSQIKLNGFRIELGEIETALQRHPRVKQAAVLMSETPTGAKHLLAYVVPDGDNLSAYQLRGFLRRSVPEYMVPHRFTILSQFPLSPNGKLDRRALPAPDETAPGSGFTLPETETQQKLAGILERLLDRRPIGMDDNFFELGGTSLLAVRFLARIEKAFQLSLPLSIFFKAPTLSGLARILEAEIQPPPVSTVVPVRAEGSLPPLFCVYSDPRYVFRYNRLSAHLGPDQPVYGVQPRCADQSRLHMVEEIAEYSIRQIKSVQPRGPYFLTGFCFGGLVAFEMARQLQRAGDEICLLALLDCASPSYRVQEAQVSLPYARRLMHHLKRVREVQGPSRTAYLRQVAGNLGTKVHRYAWKSLHRFRQFARCPMPKAFYSSAEAFVQAGLDYQGGYYQGTVIVIRAATPPPEGYLNPDLGWSDLADTVITHESPGEHFTLLTEPHVGALAAVLNEAAAGVKVAPYSRVLSGESIPFSGI